MQTDTCRGQEQCNPPTAAHCQLQDARE
jgi:hypothetical protein